MASSFGIDIGTKKIKVVMLQGDQNRQSLKACMSADMPGPGMLSESSFDLEEISETIRQLVKDANIPTSLVNAALPDSAVYSKVVFIPEMSAKDLNNAIYWEAEQNIPAPLATLNLSYQQLRKREVNGDTMLEVLIVGAQSAMVKKYRNVLEMAGLKPQCLETEIISVIRAINLTQKSPTTILMNVGRFNTSIVVIEQGVISFIYSIPLGSVAISRAVMTQFNLAEDQADQYIKVYGVSNQPTGEKIANVIQPILQSLLTEVRKALAYYSEKNKQSSTVSQIILSGQLSTLSGIDVFFVKNLGIETVIANPWKMHSIERVPKQILDTETDYATAVGLALVDYEK